MSGSYYQQLATQAAQSAGVPVDMFLAQIGIESGWDNNSVSSTGAVGLGQILPSTAASPGYGVSPVSPSQLTDPASNLNFAAQYDAALYQATGSWGNALAAYNVGPGAYQTTAPSPAYQNLIAQVNGGTVGTTTSGSTAASATGAGSAGTATAGLQSQESGFFSLLFGNLSGWIAVIIGAGLLFGALYLYGREA